MAFSKNLLNKKKTLDSAESILPFSENDIYGKIAFLSNKNGFTNFQNFIVSVKFFKSSII